MDIQDLLQVPPSDAARLETIELPVALSDFLGCISAKELWDLNSLKTPYLEHIKEWIEDKDLDEYVIKRRMPQKKEFQLASKVPTRVLLGDIQRLVEIYILCVSSKLLPNSISKELLRMISLLFGRYLKERNLY